MPLNTSTPPQHLKASSHLPHDLSHDLSHDLQTSRCGWNVREVVWVDTPQNCRTTPYNPSRRRGPYRADTPRADALNGGTARSSRTQRVSGGDPPPPAAPLAGRARRARRARTRPPVSIPLRSALHHLRLSALALSLGATAHRVGARRPDDTHRNACNPVTAARRPSIAGSAGHCSVRSALGLSAVRLQPGSCTSAATGAGQMMEARDVSSVWWSYDVGGSPGAPSRAARAPFASAWSMPHPRRRAGPTARATDAPEASH
jgi:hypothetical protein